MSASMPALSRRRLLTSVGLTATGLATAGLVGSCGRSSQASGDGGGNGAGTGGEGGWSFTDARGVEVSLDAPPERIVADTYSAASLWDFGIRPDGIFGWGLEEGSAWANTLGNIDLDAVEVVGVGGELNLEATADLRPDLIIGNGQYNVDYAANPDANPFQWVADDVLEELTALAPPLSTRWFDLPLRETIDGFEELARALGADVEAPELVAAKDDFVAAEKRLGELGNVSQPLSLLTMLAEPNTVWVANPTGYVTLEYFAELGFELVRPDTTDEPWEELAWEEVDRYPADVILFLGANPIETGDLDDRPLWPTLPAVEAGQVVSFNDKWPYSYVFYASALDGLATAFEGFSKVT